MLGQDVEADMLLGDALDRWGEYGEPRCSERRPDGRGKRLGLRAGLAMVRLVEEVADRLVREHPLIHAAGDIQAMGLKCRDGRLDQCNGLPTEFLWHDCNSLFLPEAVALIARATSCSFSLVPVASMTERRSPPKVRRERRAQTGRRPSGLRAQAPPLLAKPSWRAAVGHAAIPGACRDWGSIGKGFITILLEREPERERAARGRSRQSRPGQAHRSGPTACSAASPCPSDQVSRPFPAGERCPLTRSPARAAWRTACRAATSPVRHCQRVSRPTASAAGSTGRRADRRRRGDALVLQMGVDREAEADGH